MQIGLCVQWLWRYIFWDVRNMCLDVSSWEVFSLSPSADYTEYLICFSNQHAWGFGNSVKKDVRRSWEERWSEIAGERRPLINRRSGQLFGSHSSLSWNTSLSPSLSLRLLLLFSQSLDLPFILKQLHTFRSTEYRICFCSLPLRTPHGERRCAKWPKVFTF